MREGEGQSGREREKGVPVRERPPSPVRERRPSPSPSFDPWTREGEERARESASELGKTYTYTYYLCTLAHIRAYFYRYELEAPLTREGRCPREGRCARERARCARERVGVCARERASEIGKTYNYTYYVCTLARTRAHRECERNRLDADTHI